MDRPYYILLADDHAGFRREVRKILEEIPGDRVTGEAGNRGESAPVLQFVKDPDRKTCLPLALIVLHSTNIVDFLPDNQGQILTSGPGTVIALMVGNGEFMLGRERLIGSFTYEGIGSLAD